VAYRVLHGHSNLSKIFGGARCLQNESLRRKAKYLGLLSTTGKRQLCSANNRHPNVNSIGWQEDKCLEEEVKVRRCMHFDVADKSNGRAHHKSGPTGNPHLNPRFTDRHFIVVRLFIATNDTLLSFVFLYMEKRNDHCYHTPLCSWSR
jgi:hypothetical protein